MKWIPGLPWQHNWVDYQCTAQSVGTTAAVGLVGRVCGVFSGSCSPLLLWRQWREAVGWAL